MIEKVTFLELMRRTELQSQSLEALKSNFLENEHYAKRLEQYGNPILTRLKSQLEKIDRKPTAPTPKPRVG